MLEALIGVTMFGGLLLLLKKLSGSSQSSETPTPTGATVPSAVKPSRFVQATHFTVPTTPRQVSLIVIHTIESPEDRERAYNTARWTFAGPKAREASTHYLVDADEIVQAVDEANIAWGAEGVNGRGIHIEHAGYANQSASQWDDDYSKRELELSAQLAADIATRYGIPAEFVDETGLKEGKPGFTGHVNVNNMMTDGKRDRRPFDHNDPGPNFPWEYYLGRVKFYMGKAPNA